MKIFRRPTEIEKILEHKFRDGSLLKRALTHQSMAKTAEDSYQRLEFLGDALLGFIVGKWLFEKYPTAPEGKLTEYRRILVNCTALAKIASMFGLNRFVIYDSTGDNFQLSDSIMCDVYESLLAALYLDGGYMIAEKFLFRTLIAHSDILLNSPAFTNHKGRILELLQSRGKHPAYIVLETTGPAHNMLFKVGVYQDDKLLGIGSGSNKKDAEQEAAKHALSEMGLSNNDFSNTNIRKQD